MQSFGGFGQFRGALLFFPCTLFGRIISDFYIIFLSY